MTMRAGGGGSPRGEEQPSVRPFSQRHATVYLRFPFARNGFDDPPIDHWNPEKQKLLWRRLSSAESRSEIDWDRLSAELKVSVPFILQQSAWLYQLELDQLRHEMGRVQKWKRSTSHEPTLGPEQEEAKEDSSDSELIYYNPTDGDTTERNRTFDKVDYSSEGMTGLQKPRLGANNGAAVSRTLSAPISRSIRSSRDSSNSNSNSSSSSRRLLSMSRVLDRADTTNVSRRLAIASDNESSENEADAQTDNNKWELTSNLTDFSQGSISKSALEEALYDMSDTSSHV